MTDPVAEKSGFLKMYMSNHPDTLVAYAKWYGKVEGKIVSAEMTEIDCKVCWSDYTQLTTFISSTENGTDMYSSRH